MSVKLLEHPGALCNIVRRIALEAGAMILEYYDEAGFVGAEEKADGSPVTQADHAAEALIEKSLKDILPDVTVIGEEAACKGLCPEKMSCEYFWLVDGLDGTKQFVSGGEDFTVNIALIHNGVPILGVVYAPLLGELYAAHGEGTALRWMEESGKERELRVRQPAREGLTVMVSHTHGDGPQMNAFLNDYKVRKIVRRGSSLKLCAIAAAKADMYPRFGSTHEWDIAAGHAVLIGAGGMVQDMDGADLTYGGARKNYLNPDFVAKTPYLDADEE